MTDTLAEKQQAWIAGLREMAAFLEHRPELIPFFGDTIMRFVSADDLPRLGRQLGSAEKLMESAWDYVGFRRHFGPHRFDLLTRRSEVCERVQVGTKTVVRRSSDPAEVPEDATYCEVIEKVVEWEEEVPVYETRCPESLLAVDA